MGNDMQRTILEDIKQWRDAKGRKPLLLQGARQVGKSWALREAGQTLFDNCVVLNMDRDEDMRALFDTMKDPRRLVEQISLFKGQPIAEGRTLLIIDEIQECSSALKSLKYFNEEMPALAVAAAGSLLGVALNHGGMSFPVGQVDMRTMYPLNFTEFAAATDPHMANIIGGWHLNDPLPAPVMQRFEELYKTYLIVGGMPEAVKRWVSDRDMDVVDGILSNILAAYEMDFSKYATPEQVMKIKRVWDNMQSQLAKDNKKFRYSLIAKNARAREYEDSITWLCSAGLVRRVYNTETVKLPLRAYRNDSAFKLYLNDVGLLRRMFNLDASAIAAGNRLFTEFKGIIAENHIINALAPQFGGDPLYWTSGNSAELEGIIDYRNHIVPVEVKAAANVHAKSLHTYRNTYQPELALRFSLRNHEVRDGLMNIPLYLADRAGEFVGQYFDQRK